MIDDTKQQLINHVKAIADEIHNATYEFEANEDYEEPCAAHYLSDVLDINYITTHTKEYKGARVLVSFGGPNIWIDTDRGVVEGFWGEDYAKYEFRDNLGLDDYLEEMFNCL
jgi:hypothetical protein